FMNDCIFCKIVAGSIPSYKIYEDDEFLAFLDIFPATDAYTLVIPKKHYRWVWDVENIGRYFEVIKKIVNHYKKVAGHESIYSMVVGEEVPHAHVRIFPGDDMELSKELYSFMENTKADKAIDPAKANAILKKYSLIKKS
ncbi:MAG: HIT family protein, partial [Candidatus Dojkabacteria bacterium]